MIRKYFFQAHLFKETVLLVEGENVSAIDVAQHIDELRGNLMLQKEDRYLAPEVKAERRKLMDDDESGFEDKIFFDQLSDFFGEFHAFIQDSSQFINFSFTFFLLILFRYHKQLLV